MKIGFNNKKNIWIKQYNKNYTDIYVWFTINSIVIFSMIYLL
jgi:hypothetical protein